MSNQLQKLRQAAIQQAQQQITEIENRASKQIDLLVNTAGLGKKVSKPSNALFEPQIAAIIKGLSSTLVPLYSRIAWLNLNNTQIINAFQKNTPPSFQIFPALDTTVNRTRNAWYVVLYDLIQEGLVPLQLKGVLHTQDNFSGSGFPVITNTPVIPANTRSVYPMPGFGLTVFAGENWTGNYQGVESPIASFVPPEGVTDTDYSRVNGYPRSVKAWNAAGRPHKGGWIIATDAMPGAYVSVRQSNVLRHTGNVIAAGDFETFRFEVLEQLSTTETKIRLVLSSNAELTLESGHGMAARINETFIMTERPDIGYRWFNLYDESKRPLVWKSGPGVFGYVNNYKGDPALFFRAVKVGNTELQVGELQMGEVAMYANRNYWGKTWVLSSDLADFSKIENLDNVISSIRLGPYAAATIFQNTTDDASRSAQLLQLQQYQSQLQAQRTQLVAQYTSVTKQLKKLGVPVNSSLTASQLQTILNSFKLPGVTVPKGLSSQALTLAGQIGDIDQSLKDVETQLATFADPQQQDIVEDTPSLIGSQVGDDDMSGIDIWTQFSVEESGITARSRLQEDYRVVKNKTQRIMSYVTNLELPDQVEWIEVAATDETEIEVGTKTYTVSETTFQRFDTPASKLTITSEASGLSTPALKIRTSKMPAESWTVIFPDRSTHQQIGDLEEDALYNATITVKGVEKPIVKKDTFTKEQIGSVQKAIGYAMNAIQYDEAALGGSAQTTRYVSALGMRQSSFVLDLGSKTDSLRAISASDLGAEVDSAVSTMSQNFLKKLKKGAKDVGGAVTDTAKDVGKTASSAANTVANTTTSAANTVANTATSAANTVANTATDAANAVANVATDAADTVEDTAKDTIKDINKVIIAPVGDLIDHAGDFSEELVGEIKELGTDFMHDPAAFGNVLVAVIVSTTGEVTGFVMDTAEKVVTFVEAVVETVVTAVSEFIEYLADLFNWGDIIKVQKAIREYVLDTLDYLSSAADSPALHKKVNNYVDDFASTIIDPMRKYADKLAGDSTYDVAKKPSTGFVDEAMDKLNWLIEKVMGLISGTDFGLSLPSKMNSDLEKLATGFKAILSIQVDLLKAAGEAGWDILNMVDDVVDGNLTLKEFLGHLLNALIDIVQAGFDGMKTAINSLFSIVSALIDLFKSLMQVEWKIPGLKNFFEWISLGQDLNLINLVSLVIAVPTTILIKIGGISVDNLALPALAQSTTTKAVSVLGIISSCAFLAGTGMNAVLDYLEGTKPDTKAPIPEALVLAVALIEAACGAPIVAANTEAETNWAWTTWSYGTLLWMLDVGFYLYGYKHKDTTDEARMRRANEGGAVLGSVLALVQLGLTIPYIVERVSNRGKSATQQAVGTVEDTAMIMSIFPGLLSIAHYFSAAPRNQKQLEFVLAGANTAAIFANAPLLSFAIGDAKKTL